MKKLIKYIIEYIIYVDNENIVLPIYDISSNDFWLKDLNIKISKK